MQKKDLNNCDYYTAIVTAHIVAVHDALYINYYTTKY